MFLIFEELDTTTLHLQIRKDTEKHVLHTDRQQHLKIFHVMAVNPEGSQYLVRDADKHVHYGVRRSQLIIILEVLQLIGKIDVMVPYEGTKSHCTKFAVVRNGRKETQADHGFITFDFAYVKKATCNLTKGSRANVSESYGYLSMDYERSPDRDSGCYRPSLKRNTVGNKEIASIFIAISDSICSLDTQGDFYDPLHPLVEEQKKKFSERIGTAAGLDGEESERVIGEGMTLFCNTI
jgi:hypothetical protein